MPANLPPQYFEVEKRFRESKTLPEKIAALEAMLAIMPHHKGTDKLRATLRKKLSKLRDEGEQRRGGARAYLYSVRREGAGQVPLVGPPNVGKSHLLSALTNAEPEIADYPFTTQRPQAGMMAFENIQIQLVDLPAVTEEHTEPWVFNILRGADALLVVIDLSQDPLAELETTLKVLQAQRISILGSDPEDIEQGVFPKRTLAIGNKGDLTRAEENLSVLQELFGERLHIILISAKERLNLEVLKGHVYSLLDVLRVYSKRPGHEPDLSAPVILKCGSTVLDLAKEIHKDFYNKLQYARIWGSGKFDGQRVQRDYLIQEGDIIELHI
jgi:ribosome-interacting GTPase 1